jgi:hypothetical protein
MLRQVRRWWVLSLAVLVVLGNFGCANKEKSNQPTRRLGVGSSARVSARAGCPANHTGIYVKSGETYRFETPAGSHWRDFGFRVGPDGSSGKFYRSYMSNFDNLGKKRRFPGAPWFALMGSTTAPEAEIFLVGKKSEHRMPSSGELLLFANDLPDLYWNNSGTIWVDVTRLK